MTKLDSWSVQVLYLTGDEARQLVGTSALPDRNHVSECRGDSVGFEVGWWRGGGVQGVVEATLV